VNSVKYQCNPCTPDTPSVSHSKIIYITDSNWARQGQQAFKSDFTQLLNEAGVTVDEVYALQIISETIPFEIFPCCQINYKGGELSGSVYTTGNEKICTLTFSYSDQDAHAGEFSGLPFQSILVKVWLWK
jgi:hypothetical protein